MFRDKKKEILNDPVDSSLGTNVNFDENYTSIYINEDQLSSLSSSAKNLINHRGKLQLFNRKSVATSINDVPLSDINYKNVDFLKKFIGPSGRIIASRLTGATHRRQRVLKQEIKRAQYFGFVQYPDQKLKKVINNSSDV